MNRVTARSQRWMLRWVGAAAIVTLAACNGTEDSSTTDAGSGDDSTTTTEYTVNTASAIAQESAADYDNNVNGLITGSTLKDWIDGWETNRPSGITGKLVILQASDGESGYEFIAPDNTNVFTYSVDSSEWIETRSNGVIETISMVPSGSMMDAFLVKYDIDPSEDMIVCAQGTAGAGQAMRAGRCWYMFRYWGTAKEHLAVLNGGNQWNAGNTDLAATDFSATASTPPNDGTASVKDLPEINVALQATLRDMISAVPDTDADDPSDGIFIWDARSSGEYSPTDDSTFKNSGATQGHPNGALLLPYTEILNTGAGYTYKTKSEIQAYLDGSTNGFMDSTLNYVGAGNAYQDGDTVYTYCETTFRAMTTGIASGVILGLPTRFYDGAMWEWHSMANVNDSDGIPLLPIESPLRTDRTSRSMFIVASSSANVAPRPIVDPYATTTDAIITADKAYKTGDGSGTGSTGGSTDDSTDDGGTTLPPNPCG